MSTLSKPVGLILVLLAVCLFGQPAQAKYSGGTGEPNDPYQIATAEDLMLLGDSPEDYDKHFILTADIDLDPNLPGRKVFDRAVISPDANDTTWVFEGTPFTGVFDGRRHTISHLMITGTNYVGLFGKLGGAEIRNLGVVGLNITGSGLCVGGLLGHNSGGIVTECHSTGVVNGGNGVGGMLAWNEGTVSLCYSTGTITGGERVGGLLGINSDQKSVTDCYSTAAVSGNDLVGGLVGYNWGNVTRCYSTGAVTGISSIGGLVGSQAGNVFYGAWHSVWDKETSGLTASAGGVGLTTVQMMDPYMLSLNGFAGDPNWVLDAGRDYPRLAWENMGGQIIAEPNLDWLEGEGTEEHAYRVDTADQLVLLGNSSILWDKHFVLGADVDLDPNLPGRQVFGQAAIPAFRGLFDGNGHRISHLTLNGQSCLGLFGRLSGEVRNLGVVDVNIGGVGGSVGGLVSLYFIFGKGAERWSCPAPSCY